MSSIKLIRIAMAFAMCSIVDVAYAAETGALSKLLDERCVLCHQGDAAPLGLKLDSIENLMAGSKNGPVVLPGEPDNSEIILRIRGTKTPRMPMTGEPWLTDSEVALVADWIAAGAIVSPAQTTTANTQTNNVATEAAEKLVEAVPVEEPANVTNTNNAALLEDNQGVVSYLEVAPIFATRCAKCHSEQGIMGPAPEGYRLTSYEDTLVDDERARVIPGNPAGSELLRRVKGLSTPRMPFDGPPFLSDEEIATIESWIKDGARDSQGQPRAIPVGANVRFEGILTASDQIDDARFKIDSNTRVDKSPRLGGKAELRARVDGDGGLLAMRLRRR